MGIKSINIALKKKNFRKEKLRCEITSQASATNTEISLHPATTTRNVLLQE
jgi:hypothetical protein